MLRRVFLLLALTVVLGLTAGPLVHAQQALPEVVEFRLSDSPGGSAVTSFGPGVQRVYAIFRYQNAARTRIGVSLMDSTGLVMFQKQKEYSGNGQDAFEITGQMVYQRYFDQVATQATNAVTALDAALAASGQSRVLDQMYQAAWAGDNMRRVLQVLSRYPLDSDTKANLTQALARMDSFKQLTDGLDYRLSEAELRSRAQQMKEHVQAARQLSDQARSTGGDGAGLGFLETPEGQTNIANIEIEGDPVQTIEWTVAASSAGATSSPTPTNTAAPTRTPTNTPAGVAASATPLPTRTATLPSAGTATRTLTPVRPSPTTPPAGYPTATATAGAVSSPTEPTPTAIGTTSPTIEALDETPETPPPTAETPAVIALEGTPTTTAAPTLGVTPALQRRATPTPAAAAPGTGLPLGTIGIVAGALVLGLVALWFRRQM